MTNIFIVDIDHTIIKLDSFYKERERLVRQYRELTDDDMTQALKNVKNAYGRYSMESIVHELLDQIENGQQIAEEVIEQLYQFSFAHSFYDRVHEGLTALQKLGRLVIFSQGQERLQKQKIQSLLDSRFVNESDVYIHEDKIAQAQALIDQFDHDAQIIVFDDHKHYLHRFVEIDPKIVTVLVETQEKARDESIPEFTPTIAVPTFYEGVKKVEELIHARH